MILRTPHAPKIFKQTKEFLLSSISHDSLFNDKSIYPGAQMKILWDTPDSSLSLTPYIQSISQFWWFKYQNMYSVYGTESLLTNFTATLVKFTTISCLDHCGSFLTHLPASKLTPWLVWPLSFKRLVQSCQDSAQSTPWASYDVQNEIQLLWLP